MPPPPYSVGVNARFTQTWNAHGHVRTGNQVLAFNADIVSSLPPIPVYCYQFEFASVLYEFNIVGEKSEGLVAGDDFIVFINPSDLSKCWGHGHELVVHPWEPDEEL